jgi:antigen 43
MPCEHASYYHMELDKHDVLTAEGLLAESYLDTGNRANFANCGASIKLFANFTKGSRDVAAL